MAERPDLAILGISLEAGHTSKATFGNQLPRIEGMSPNEYRHKIAVGVAMRKTRRRPRTEV